MLRFLIALAVLTTASECGHPAVAGQAWRASEMNGDKPALGYELRRENGAVAGDAYILNPDFPHDFSHGRRAAMTVVEQSPREIVFRVRWSDDLKGTLRFRFKDADWPDAFQATVTEINGSEEYDSDTFNFTRTR
jgi:hypothetical protein